MKRVQISVIMLLFVAALSGCRAKTTVSTSAPTTVPETPTPVESIVPTPVATPSAAAPAYSAAPHVQYGGGSSSYENSDDPYNARDYTGADDFYDDNYDDFDSYEDAETYWEDNAG